MNIQILQENFLKALTRVSRVIPARPQLPVLQNVRLKATKDGLELTGTNMETTETVWVGGKVVKEGEICVAARVLAELVTSLPPDAVELHVKENTLYVTCKGFSATLPGILSSEFPPVAELSEKDLAIMDKNTLAGIFESVLFSAATDEGRPVLTGIKIKEDSGTTVFASTDGYRLSVKKLSMPVPKMTDVIVPARAMGEIVKISREEKEETNLKLGLVGENQIGVKIGETILTTRLLDGEYPNFDRIIPKNHTTRAHIEKEPFMRAVRSAAIFARDNANIVKMVLDRQHIVISANAPQVGEDKVEVPVEMDGDGGEIAFNSRFLLDFLSNFPDEEFLFEMTGALNPGVFKPVKDDSYLHIIMPVRVTS